jgi:hypothetical protein
MLQAGELMPRYISSRGNHACTASTCAISASARSAGDAAVRRDDRQRERDRYDVRGIDAREAGDVEPRGVRPRAQAPAVRVGEDEPRQQEEEPDSGLSEPVLGRERLRERRMVDEHEHRRDEAQRRERLDLVAFVGLFDAVWLSVGPDTSSTDPRP